MGVGADCGCNDLPEELKDRLRDSNTEVIILIRVMDYTCTVKGRGHPDLSLTHKEDIVIRKSDFTCPRTLAVRCDKASDLLPQEMITLLGDPDTRGTFTILVE